MSKESFSVMEGVIAAGALITSAAAVFIAWDQAKTMRVEQHASVFPAIQVDPYARREVDGIYVGFTVENAGVGPAFIRSARLLNEQDALTGYEEITRLVPGRVDIKFEQLTGRTLAPGVSRDALQLHWNGLAMPTELENAAYASTGDMRMEVCYCSTLDRCWISTSGDRIHPQRVDTCPDASKDGLF